MFKKLYCLRRAVAVKVQIVCVCVCGGGGCWYCTRVISLHAFSALVSFGSDDLNGSLPRRANSQLAWTADCEWRLASRKLSSLCCCCSY